ncbi:hypothetical protein MRB53_035040 [Persea americana]|uniref:Uncharacterized protein n=1 Tax=Persea americana TaxID=3435 RepID=A0ACC2K3I0_PERAE|nr:hypothetical protein MRB53_035040 [Persea americana]
MSDPIAINDCSYLSGRTVFPGGRWRPTLILALWSEAKGGLAVACLCTELASMPSCRAVVLSYRAIEQAAELLTELPSY